ncbi:hypothetical protein VBD025_16415 [Virgibacillus flavescens]|uniref:hypothetical protein n=1 Tax=Virgibacillus flavescens TaxID=1611422 RepID=UPI003D32DA7B
MKSNTKKKKVINSGGEKINNKIKQFICIIIVILLCSGCNFGGSDNLIPDNTYSQIFVKKRIGNNEGEVELKKIWDEEKINKIIDLLNSVPVKAPNGQQTNEIELKLGEEGSYILSFFTQQDLDNQTTKSVYYLALLPDGQIVYSGAGDHELKLRLMSTEKHPEMVEKIIEML